MTSPVGKGMTSQTILLSNKPKLFQCEGIAIKDLNVLCEVFERRVRRENE